MNAMKHHKSVTQLINLVDVCEKLMKFLSIIKCF